jgi:hypothetical protein
MIKPINTPAGEKTMLLGYEVIRFMTKPVAEGKDEFDQIEEIALIGFNTWNKRHNEPQITREEMLSYFDDENAYLDVIDAVKAFNENFTKRVSG